MDSKERSGLQDIFLDGQQLTLQLNGLMQQHANEPTVPVLHAMLRKLIDALRFISGFAMGSLPYTLAPDKNTEQQQIDYET
jgi:hypothetical protein